MDRAALLGQLVTVFLAELEEHVHAQNRDVLALEAPGLSSEQRAEILRNLLRSAHSLKGASRAVSAASIERLCHGLEELFTEIATGKRALDKEIFALLFAGIDALEDAGKRLRGGASFEGSPADAVSVWLASVLHGQAIAPIAEPRSPPSPSAEKPEARRDESRSDVSPIEPAPKPAASAEVSPSDVPPLEPPSLEPASLRRPAGATDAGHVRVAVRKLDALLTQSGELSVALSRMDRSLEDIELVAELFTRLRVEWQKLERPMAELAEAPVDGGLSRSSVRSIERVAELAARIDFELEHVASSMRSSTHDYRAVASALDAEVKNVRMLPFAEACQGLVRMVRDLAQDRGKDVELVITGGDVELDRSVLEGLKDPLVHLVRNAVDHGIELPAARSASGKPARGRVEISATLRGAEVLVTVTDDGRGLDIDAIAERASDKGMVVPSSPDALARLIFLPGFSTSRALSVVSGRGVGLDVVKIRVEALHGHVDVASAPSRGACFSLTVPLTITTIRAVIVEVTGQLFAFASTNVERLVRIGDGDLRWVTGRPVLIRGDGALDLIPLAELLGLPVAELGHEGRGAHVVIASGRGHAVGFIVDALVGVEEILVKNLGRRLRRVRYVSGAAALSTGRLALILSVGELIGEASRRATARGFSSTIPREMTTAPPKKRILVVDDSLTSRALGKSILEAAGFEVLVAVDGQEALRIVEERDVDLVLSDVEMPRMDGLALTASLRASRKHARLPVVLMTGLGSERDKARGLEVGADAYLVKSAFDKDQLLETIAQLL